MDIDQKKLEKFKIKDLLPDKVARGKKAFQMPLTRKCSFPRLRPKINIKFMPSNSDVDEVLNADLFNARRIAGPHSSKKMRENLSIYSEDIQRLKKLEPAILDWLRKDKVNLAFFVINPIAALGQIGKKLDDDLLKKIDKASRIAKRRKPPIPEMEFSSIRAEVINTDTSAPSAK